MRPASIATAFCALELASCEGPQTLPDVEQSFTVSGGAFVPGSDGWDGRAAGAIGWSWRGEEWPCALEFGVQYARAELEEGSDPLDVDVFDMRIGAASSWRPAEWLVLAAGAGPRLSFAQTWVPGEYAEIREDSTSVGLYAHAGAFVRVSDMFSIGADVQAALGSDYDLAGEDRDAQAAGLMLALRWDF